MHRLRTSSNSGVQSQTMLKLTRKSETGSVTHVGKLQVRQWKSKHESIRVKSVQGLQSCGAIIMKPGQSIEPDEKAPRPRRGRIRTQMWKSYVEQVKCGKSSIK